MVDYDTIASGVRNDTVTAEVFSEWLLAREVLWFIVEGEFDVDGSPINVRPIVTSHPSGANITFVFTDRERAERHLAGLAEVTGTVLPAPPAEAFPGLLAMPIDGITINPGDSTRLNAGRGQLHALARQAADSGQPQHS